MRAQQRAGRRSAQTLQDRQEFVNSDEHLPDGATSEPAWASAERVDLPGPRFKRLFVGISTVDVPGPDVCLALLRAVPHRHLVGQLIDLGENPFMSPWAGFAQRHGLGLTAYVPNPNDSALALSELELHLAAARGLRDPKVDAVLLLGLASPPAPIAKLIRASGRALILGVRSEFVDRALRVADAVVDLDAVEVALAEGPA